MKVQMNSWSHTLCCSCLRMLCCISGELSAVPFAQLGLLLVKWGLLCPELKLFAAIGLWPGRDLCDELLAPTASAVRFELGWQSKLSLCTAWEYAATKGCSAHASSWCSTGAASADSVIAKQDETNASVMILFCIKRSFTRQGLQLVEDQI